MDGRALRSDAERIAAGVVVHGGLADDRGLLRWHTWVDIDGRKHRSLSVPPKRRRRPRGLVLGVLGSMARAGVIAGAVVAGLVVLGVV